MRSAVALGCALLVLWTRPAVAWDPFARGAADDAPASPSPARLVVPPDLYVVTDVYDGDVVITSGNTTVYSTTTVRHTPGTYARVIDVVATGEASRFDGDSFNRRARLADGRLVAGTYYEDFILTAAGFVSVNIVFFQDDRAMFTTPAPSPTATSMASASTGGAAVPRPSPTSAPRTPTHRPPNVRAGIALGRTAPTIASIEVLRGRAVALWPRAFVDGAPVEVRTWRLVSGGADSVSPSASSGTEPYTATWLTLPPAGTVVTMRFEVTTDAAPGRALSAFLTVAVRSPALLE